MFHNGIISRIHIRTTTINVANILATLPNGGLAGLLAIICYDLHSMVRFQIAILYIFRKLACFIERHELYLKLNIYYSVLFF